MKVKRKARKSTNKDIEKPVTLETIGSKDDPCFGKHHDMRTDECQRCGDAEFCCIVMGQNNTVRRNKVEKTKAFKDVEEKTIPKKDDKEIRKEIKQQARDIIKFNGKQGIDKTSLINELYILFGRDGFNQERLTKIVSKMAKFKSDLILTHKNKYSWKKSL